MIMHKPSNPARHVSLILDDDTVEWLDNVRRYSDTDRIPSRSEVVRALLDLARTTLEALPDPDDEADATLRPLREPVRLR